MAYSEQILSLANTFLKIAPGSDIIEGFSEEIVTFWLK